MRRLMLGLMIGWSGWLVLPATLAVADGCYSCGSGSTTMCQQCAFFGKDVFAARKYCMEKGCKVTAVVPCERDNKKIKFCEAHPAADAKAAGPLSQR